MLISSVLKSGLQKWIERGAFESDLEIRNKAKQFISTDYQYFFDNNYFENELADLNLVIHESWRFINLFLFNEFKKILHSSASWVTADKEVNILS